jgi:hypothetical protein
MQCSKQRFYSITSSASCEQLVPEFVSPSAFAVLKLITSSNLVEALRHCHDTQFIAAKVSTTLRLLTLIMPMPVQVLVCSLPQPNPGLPGFGRNRTRRDGGNDVNDPEQTADGRASG